MGMLPVGRLMVALLPARLVAPLVDDDPVVDPDANAVVGEDVEAVVARRQRHVARPAHGEAVDGGCRPGDPVPQLKSMAASLRVKVGAPMKSLLL
jgi:hypothetical protein